MPRLHLLAEGQTEEIVARDVVVPHLTTNGWTVSVSILATKHPAAGGKIRGGVRSWGKIRHEIRLLLRSFDLVTTMIDYYGFPANSPGMDDRPVAAATDRVRHVERAVATAVGDPRFVPHLTLHETEAWVFAAADALADLVGDWSVARDLRKVVDEAGGPELVNDDPATAPSKRLRARLPAYQKTLHGPLCIADLGLAALRTQCPHLDSWLVELERRTG
jgi:hypothetical protein